MDRFNLMDTEEQYVPEVNDYVIWENDLGTIDEGWVYWKGTRTTSETLPVWVDIGKQAEA